MNPDIAYEIYQDNLRSYKCQKLVFKQFGDPVKVVSLEECMIKEPYGSEVLVKMLLVPVNPADMNMIQGKYPLKPKLPAMPGIEGVGVVFKTGFNVVGLDKGDHVIVDGTVVGTWGSLCVFQAEDLIKVPKKVPIEVAAGLAINSVTAHRMLTDYVDLQPGDNVIQNGANSACGQNIIQFCKLWGLHSINIVRNRPDIYKLKQHLSDLGADYVYTEEEFNSLDEKKFFFTRPRLALNCVGGSIVSRMLKFMAPGGTVVTYGGMSYNPVTIPTTSFIFDDLTFRGFWLKKWLEHYRNKDKIEPMMKELFELAEKKYLLAPTQKVVPLSQFKEALENTLSPKGHAGHKYLIDFRKIHEEQEKEWKKEKELRTAKEREERKKRSEEARQALDRMLVESRAKKAAERAAEKEKEKGKEKEAEKAKEKEK